MPRNLNPNHQAALPYCTRRSTLQITFGDGTPLYFSVMEDLMIGGELYLAKLAPVDELNVELTAKTEGVNFKITNAKMLFGQNLINTQDILSGSEAILGCFFRDARNGDEWHDVKMSGTIKVGKINRQWINVYFQSFTTGKIYNGVSIASVFPNSEIPVAEIPTPPAPVYNDIISSPAYGGGVGGGLVRDRDFDLMVGRYEGRYLLPDLLY